MFLWLLASRALRRYIADYRLVVATMHSDVIPAAYVRGFCVVKHKEHIKNMHNFKEQEDAFYWTQVSRAVVESKSELIHLAQLYDRYLHRYFDAVPVNKIRNAPGPKLGFPALAIPPR